MEIRGRGHQGRPRGVSQAPPIFDQHTFAEAVGIAAAVIAQASAVVAIAQASASGNQGGPSNL